MHILVTGGAGFIGSNFIRLILREHPQDTIVNFDKLTYAGNPENVRDVEADPVLAPRYQFVHGDICDAGAVDAALHDVDAVVNFAAETHVDRSITGPDDFIRTDVIGTHVLLEAVRRRQIGRYVQVSTDEVYGSIESGSFVESDPLRPSSPYSASKASGDLLSLAYHTTYGLPVLVTRSSNNYGPYQYPEKLIPLFATNALDGLPLPLYGDGQNVRDWIHVEDNCRALDFVLRNGREGEVYNIGGGNERSNLDITRLVLQEAGRGDDLIRHVADRLGHDRRYSVDSSKLSALGWTPRVGFEEGMRQTLDWYARHRDWWEPIKSGQWRQYYQRHYRELAT